MVTKRVSTGKKATRKKATNGDGATEHTSGAVLSNVSVQSVKHDASHLDPDVRRQLVAAEAYFRAERRGFAAGSELEDWVAAEKAVASRFQQAQVV